MWGLWECSSLSQHGSSQPRDVFLGCSNLEVLIHLIFEECLNRRFALEPKDRVEIAISNLQGYSTAFLCVNSSTIN